MNPTKNGKGMNKHPPINHIIWNKYFKTLYYSIMKLNLRVAMYSLPSLV